MTWWLWLTAYVIGFVLVGGAFFARADIRGRGETFAALMCATYWPLSLLAMASMAFGDFLKRRFAR